MLVNAWLGGTGNWDTPSDWSAGLPDASSVVVIDPAGGPEVTESFGTVYSINDGADLTFINAGASSVIGDVFVRCEILVTMLFMLTHRMATAELC